MPEEVKSVQKWCISSEMKSTSGASCCAAIAISVYGEAKVEMVYQFRNKSGSEMNIQMHVLFCFSHKHYCMFLSPLTYGY